MKLLNLRILNTDFWLKDQIFMLKAQVLGRDGKVIASTTDKGAT
jgi:hypothetical protein